jgi:hypothetical protein
MLPERKITVSSHNFVASALCHQLQTSASERKFLKRSRRGRGGGGEGKEFLLLLLLCGRHEVSEI